MIKIENLGFKYSRKEPYIFNDLSIAFTRGRIYFVKGENGSGKTTLMKLILGILKPSYGRVCVEAKLISYLPDYNGLYQYLTVMENIKYRLALYERSFAEKKPEVENLLSKYNLSLHQDKLVKQLSRGMLKKVGLICACIVEPELLVIDEPTEGMDTESRDELLSMMREMIRDDAVVICVTHDQMLLSSQAGIVINLTPEGAVEVED